MWNRHAGRKEAAQCGRWEADAQDRYMARVAPEIACLDREIARHTSSLDHTTSRLKRREAATQTVIHDGLEQQRQASRLADRITAERDRLDGAPSAADGRRAALRREQLRSVGLTPQHEPPGWQAPGIEM
jgi:hypothetical protein